MIEHGCEKHHNDSWLQVLRANGIPPESMGWASVQGDGGIDRVSSTAIDWFISRAKAESALAMEPSRPLPNSGGPNSGDPNSGDTRGAAAVQQREEVDIGSLTLGLLSLEDLPASVACVMAEVCRLVVEAGGTVVVPEGTALLRSAHFLDDLLELHSAKISPSVDFGAPCRNLGGKRDGGGGGVHVMAAQTSNWSELLSGLCASGAMAVLSFSTRAATSSGHPLMPVVQLTQKVRRLGTGGRTGGGSEVWAPTYAGADVVLDDFNEAAARAGASVAADGPTASAVWACGWVQEVMQHLTECLSKERETKSAGNTDFQMTRGATGCSN
jgi:hypothetical protein